MEVQGPAQRSAQLPPPIFTTARLTIRPLHPQDAASMSHHADNPNVTTHLSLGFPSPYPLSSATHWISLNLTPPIYNWAICLSSSPSVVIGGVGLKPGVDVQTHAAEVGYWIGEAHWGKGLVSECVAGLSEWVFAAEESRWAGGEWGRRWTRLWGGVFAGNGASARCFEKCGYVREGVLRGAVEKHGVVSDLVVWGLLREEWEEGRCR